MTDAALDTYYARMSGSLGDKARVLDYIEGTRVLDVGCGSGDLLHLMLEEGFDAYGIDPATESLERVIDASRVVRGYADEILDHFGEGYFDTIICSSVLHEVFSYGNSQGWIGDFDSLHLTFNSINKALRPGGRLIVRDGVEPENGSSIASMHVNDPGWVYKFLAESPFSITATDGFAAEDRGVYITGNHHNPRYFEGTRSSLMEFAFTYTWGPDSWEREVQEFYGILSLDNYAAYVEYHGFNCVEKYAYIQQGYVEHLRGKIEFGFDFPNTNAVWVYNKVDAG